MNKEKHISVEIQEDQQVTKPISIEINAYNPFSLHSVLHFIATESYI